MARTRTPATRAERPQEPRERPKRAGVVSDATNAPAGALGAIYAAMTEAELQRSVRTYLTARGYRVWVFPIMKRTMAGVPDLTFWHPAQPGRLYFWELKRERGRIRPEQQAALDHLATVPGVDARIVRPSQWPLLRDALEVVLEATDREGSDR